MLSLCRRSFWAVVVITLCGCSKAGSGEPASEPEEAVEATGGSDRAKPPTTAKASAPSPPDSVETSEGPLEIIPVHHGTLAFRFKEKTIWIDPWTKADLSRAPHADYIFITDSHPDHLDPAAVEQVKQEDTLIIGPQVVADRIPGTLVMKNGDAQQFAEFAVEATAMYNLERGPEPGKLYHDRGRGNGYLFAFGDQRVYLSGDTACTEEMRALSDVDVAFVCMNLPYTMPPEEAAECVLAFKPSIVYPFHYRGSDLDGFEAQVTEAGIEVRLREWY